MTTPIVVFLISLALVTSFWLSVDNLKEWQPLVGALLALVAAFLTIVAILKQVRSQREDVDRQLKAAADSNEEHRKRKLLASRAVLPADLSAMSAYVRDSAEVAANALLMLRNQQQRQHLSLPVMPERVLSNLQRLIENVDREDAEALSDLLKCYQIQNSRLVGEIQDFNEPKRLARERVMTEQNIEHTFDETLRLSLLIDNALAFARRSADHISAPRFSAASVANNLSVLGISDLISDICRNRIMKQLATEDLGDK